jgi:hypothetical protein
MNLAIRSTNRFEQANAAVKQADVNLKHWSTKALPALVTLYSTILAWAAVLLF